LLLPPAVLIAACIGVAAGGWVVLAADRAEPVRFGAREIAVLVREGCVRALFIVLSPIGWVDALAPGPATRPDPHKLPVLLVTGRGMNRTAFAFLQVFLAERGFTMTWSINPPPGDLGLGEQAEALARRVDDLCRATGAERIDVVAHSLGGLVAAWYVRHLDGARKVRRLVTLGTPWKGTRTAVFGRGRVAAESTYGSPLLESLAPPPVPTVAIWSPDDPVVVPSSSAMPQGADSVCIDGLGHVDLLASALAFRAVVAALTTPLPALAEVS
jgi:triacylglycerol lipase